MSRFIPSKLTDLVSDRSIGGARAQLGESLHVVPDGATITFDLSVARHHYAVLGGNRMLRLANVTAGQPFTVLLGQDGTGSRTVTWFSGIRWPSGTAPTLTTAAGKIDVFTFMPISTTSFIGMQAGADH